MTPIEFKALQLVFFTLKHGHIEYKSKKRPEGRFCSFQILEGATENNIRKLQIFHFDHVSQSRMVEKVRNNKLPTKSEKVSISDFTSVRIITDPAEKRMLSEPVLKAKKETLVSHSLNKHKRKI